MAGPIVYVSHFRIKSDRIDEWWNQVAEMIPELDAAKPRTAFQHFYVDEAGTSVSIVHVFADADAMDLHMEGASDRSRAAMEFLEPIGFELYGQPTDRFKAAMGDMSSLLQIHPTHNAGFDRL